MPATDTHKHVLIVDRDLAAVEPLRQKLGEAGFAARAVADAAAVITAMSTQPPHLAIVDWNVADVAAFRLVADLRKVRVPHPIRLILMSAMSGESDVVAGLSLGADDYIAKPYSPREVVARVAALLRSRREEDRGSVISCNELVLDLTTNHVTVCGQALQLRGAEYRLLEFLMSHPGRAFDRKQLLAQVWGKEIEVDERTVDVNVQRLRRNLVAPGYEKYIQTVRGLGYRFADPADPGPE
jgi:two-component system, OmpR family, phosphate regulon response regulator PhoB